MGLPIPEAWMFKDPEGDWYPWYTESFLAELETWDVSDCDVLEYGSGWSTIWWAKRAKFVTAVENDPEWVETLKQEIAERGITNVDVIYEPNPQYYSKIQGGAGRHDIIVIDGIERVACTQTAFQVSQLGKTKIILDNANDPAMAPIFDMMRFNVRHSFPQPRHPDWLTDYWVVDTCERWDQLSYSEAHTMEIHRQEYTGNRDFCLTGYYNRD